MGNQVAKSGCRGKKSSSLGLYSVEIEKLTAESDEFIQDQVYIRLQEGRYTAIEEAGRAQDNHSDMVTALFLINAKVLSAVYLPNLLSDRTGSPAVLPAASRSQPIQQKRKKAARARREKGERSECGFFALSAGFDLPNAVSGLGQGLGGALWERGAQG